MTVGQHKGVRAACLVGLPIALIFGGGYAFMRIEFPQFYADTSIYSVSYSKPVGWKEVPPGPFTLFVFHDPEGHGSLRASVNEVQSKVNPTPELDTNGIADHYIGLTADNMPDWTAKRLDDIVSPTERFSVIKRTKRDRTVYTAFCSKGNTTVVVSLTAGGKKQLEGVEGLVPAFRQLVSSFKLTPKYVAIDE